MPYLPIRCAAVKVLEPGCVGLATPTRRSQVMARQGDALIHEGGDRRRGARRAARGGGAGGGVRRRGHDAARAHRGQARAVLASIPAATAPQPRPAVRIALSARMLISARATSIVALADVDCG